MKAIGYGFAALMAAMTITANLMQLIPTNPNYDASWWKIGLAMVAYCYFISQVKDRRP